jgi:hypothetical protein
MAFYNCLIENIQVVSKKDYTTVVEKGGNTNRQTKSDDDVVEVEFIEESTPMA